MGLLMWAVRAHLMRDHLSFGLPTIRAWQVWMAVVTTDGMRPASNLGHVQAHDPDEGVRDATVRPDALTASATQTAAHELSRLRECRLGTACLPAQHALGTPILQRFVDSTRPKHEEPLPTTKTQPVGRKSFGTFRSKKVCSSACWTR